MAQPQKVFSVVPFIIFTPSLWEPVPVSSDKYNAFLNSAKLGEDRSAHPLPGDPSQLEVQETRRERKYRESFF